MTPIVPKLSGIIPAAGSAHRFGSDKRRWVLPNGEELLEHVVRRLGAVVHDVVVVLRADDHRLAERLNDAPCRVVFNPGPEEGMGGSIRRGVKATASSSGWLIMPADLPLVREHSIRRIAAELQRSDAAVPICHGRRGHPVGMSRRFLLDLLRLAGDRGARQILAKAPRAVSWVNVDDPGIYQDIDRPRDRERLQRYLARNA